MANTDKKTYSIEEAISELKTQSKAKFDATVELHINLGIDIKKPDQNLRFTTVLPAGTGKTPKITVFATKKIEGADLELTEADLEKIEKGQIKPGNDFDVLVVEPKLMSKLAKVGRVLGPAGVMPNPKTGTVTEDVEKAVEQIKKGKIEIRNEPNAPIVHTLIGKMSFDTKALIDNYNEVITGVRQHRPQKVKPDNYVKSCFITSTMGPSFKIAAA